MHVVRIHSLLKIWLENTSTIVLTMKMEKNTFVKKRFTKAMVYTESNEAVNISGEIRLKVAILLTYFGSVLVNDFRPPTPLFKIAQNLWLVLKVARNLWLVDTLYRPVILKQYSATSAWRKPDVRVMWPGHMTYRPVILKQYSATSAWRKSDVRVTWPGHMTFLPFFWNSIEATHLTITQPWVNWIYFATRDNNTN